MRNFVMVGPMQKFRKSGSVMLSWIWPISSECYLSNARRSLLIYDEQEYVLRLHCLNSMPSMTCMKTHYFWELQSSIVDSPPVTCRLVEPWVTHNHVNVCSLGEVDPSVIQIGGIWWALLKFLDQQRLRSNITSKKSRSHNTRTMCEPTGRRRGWKRWRLWFISRIATLFT